MLFHIGNTALIYSAMVGNDIAIEILTKCFRRLGLLVDHVNKEGVTALIIAARNGFIECASILALDGRASVTIRDGERSMNAEQWARACGCSTPDIVSFSQSIFKYHYGWHDSALDNDAGAMPAAEVVSNCSSLRGSPTLMTSRDSWLPGNTASSPTRSNSVVTMHSVCDAVDTRRRGRTNVDRRDVREESAKRVVDMVNPTPLVLPKIQSIRHAPPRRIMSTGSMPISKLVTKLHRHNSEDQILSPRMVQSIPDTDSSLLQ